MFTGLSAFPFTPLVKGEIDEKTFGLLIENLANAGADSIGALGSTGCYAYLTRDQRFRATTLAVSAASGVPVITSIGSINADEVLRLADDAQQAGVRGVLLAPVSYQPLHPDEVFQLYDRVTRELSVPLCIYDNPTTTGFDFTDELLVALSAMKNIGSIKLASLERAASLKNRVPETVTLGISGDAQSAQGLMAGCDVWYSVLGGLFPQYALSLTRAALQGDGETTERLNIALEPLWGFYRRHGSLRTIATLAELTGVVSSPCLPFPLQTLAGPERAALENVLRQMPFLTMS